MKARHVALRKAEDSMTNGKKVSSPSRRYVAVCNKMNWDGHYFRSFTLPEFDPRDEGRAYENNASVASWYFLNRLDGMACIEGCVTAEDFASVKEAQ
jgi:hypothetical protein